MGSIKKRNFIYNVKPGGSIPDCASEVFVLFAKKLCVLYGYFILGGAAGLLQRPQRVVDVFL